jgi:hypothetical protein
MFLFRLVRFQLPGFGVLASAATALLLAAEPASAQQPSGPQIPLGAKAFQAAMIQQEFWQHQAQKRAEARPAPDYRNATTTPAAPAAVTMVVTLPARVPAVRSESPVLAVDLRGPDGQVRRFAVEGGPEAIQLRTVVVRPGETATIQFQAIAQAK